MLTIKKLQDPMTGVTIRTIGAEDAHTVHQYFTAMSWLSDNEHILLCTQIDEEKNGRYVLANINDGSTEVVVDWLVWGGGVVSNRNHFYYSEGPTIYEKHLITGVTRIVCRLQEDEVVYGPLSITNDCEWLGIYWNKGGEWSVGVVELATGEVRTVATPNFQEPYPIANHAMINPVYSNLMFFSHEGQTENIPDRIYLVDTNSGIMKNGYQQKKLETGELVEFVGHEMWAADGEHLYFVKYPQSPLKPTGVHRVDKWTGEATAINSDYAYWHASVSPDGKWAVADTIEQTEVSKIVLINLQTRASHLLCEVPIWWQHPGHPHPSFSADSRKISFIFADEKGKLVVGIIHLDEVFA